MSTKQNIYGSLFVSNNISGDTLSLSTLNNNDSLTEMLARNSSGLIEYRDVQSIISAATSQDTFITGFTYNDSNTFVISDNSGSTFSATINNVTGLTSVGDINIIGNLVVTGGTGNVITKQIYLEGNLGLDWDFLSSSVVLGNNVNGTIVNGTSLTVNSDTLVNGSITGNSLNLSSTTNDNSLTQILGRNSTTGDVEYRDVSSIIGAASADTYVVSGNADAATSQLSFTYNTGGTFTVANSAALFSDNDINVTGGTYNPSTGCVTFATNSGTTFDVCGFVTGITDSYTTGSTLVGESIQFDNNILGSNYYSVSLTPALSGKTDVSNFESYTANTKVEIDSKLNISTFNNYTANTTDFFVTGGTYSSGTATFENNNGDSFNVTGFTEPFTGNTSGDCIDELWVKNISGCTSEDLHIGVESGKDIYFDSTGTTDSPSLYINSRGQIGVGTNTPFSWATTDGTGIEIHNDSINNQIPFAVTETGTRRFFIETDFATTSNPVHIKGSSSTNLMTFYTSSSSSRVGIGTTIPEGSFQIAKSGTVSDQTKYPSETNVVINNTSNGYSGSTGAANSAAFRFDHETSEIPGGLITSKRRDTWGSGEKSTSFEIWNNSGETLIKRFEILPDGKTTIIGSLNIDTILSGTPVINLGIDSSGNVVTGITDTVDITRVQPGTNINTGGTANNPIVNLEDDILLTSVSATNVSGGTIYSGSTDLSDIFLTTADGNDITRVQGGTNITTGGTANNPTVNLDSDISLNSISANNLSGGTIYSGSTDLYNIIESLDTYITGGTYDESTDSITLGRNDAGKVLITGITDTFYWTTGSTGNFSLKAINDSGLDATGNYAVAEGGGTIASGNYSHAEGFETTASSPEAHSEGYQTTASGEDSHAENLFTISSGDYSHAEGWSTTASGEDSHSEGFGNVASGADSHAEGLNNTASNTASHAQGFNTTSTGTASHSEGFDTLSSADASHSEGYSSTASGLASHAEGFETTSSGSFSHSGGFGSIASGDTSFVHSTNSLASGSRSAVLGGQNITGTTDDTVYVPYLNINNLASGTSINNIGLDSSGNVVLGVDGNDITRVQGGTNVSTGGTANNPIINLDSDISLTSVSAINLSGGTIYSGSTDLSDIFLTTADGNDITRVQGGTNITTGGTANSPIINVVNSPSFDNLTASGSTILSGLTTVYGNSPVSAAVQPGVDNSYDLGAPSFRWREIYTTNLDATNAVTVNSLYAGFEIESPSISGTSVSATTFYSGSTDLSDIFLTTADGNDITRVQPGNNINTGGTANNPIVNLDDDIYLNSVSATTISGGTFYGDGSNLSGINDFYLTGQTFDNSNYILTSSLNDGSILNADLSVLASDIFVVSGVYTPSTGVVTYTNSSGGTFNVSGFTTGMTDSYTNAANLNGNLIEFDNNIQGSNLYSVDLSPALSAFTTGNTYVTGFTYNNANTFTISRNDDVDISASINTLTGLTVDGVLSATTYTGLTLNSLDDVTTNIPTTPDATYQGELLYFDTVSNQWVSGEEYGNLGDVTIWGKKGSAGTIDKGCPVYIVGFDADIHEVELANASTGSTMPVIGFTAEDFDNAGVYPIVTFGKVTGVDTTSAVSTINPNGETWAVNDVLFVNTTDGGLTKNRPSGSNTQIQRVAKILKVGATDGQIFIFNTARTAGLPNLTTDYLWVGNGNDTPQEVIKTDVGVTTTGLTYNNNNTLTITDDNGGILATTINQMSGLTINGTLSATTIDGNTILSGGTNLTTIIESLDTYVTGGTVSVPATDNTNSGSIGLFYKNSDGIPRTLPFEDTFVTGTTFTSNEATLTRNDGVDVLKITGDTNVVLSNPSANQIKLGLDLGIKSGTVRGVDFTGTPLTIKVTFTTPYPDTDYSVNVTGSINRNFTFESKTAASFIISSNSSTSFSDDVDWFTIKYGEQ